MLKKKSLREINLAKKRAIHNSYLIAKSKKNRQKNNIQVVEEEYTNPEENINDNTNNEDELTNLNLDNNEDELTNLNLENENGETDDNKSDDSETEKLVNEQEDKENK